jgi:hypothetical protein
VGSGGEERRVVARGRDIYAVTAPLVVTVRRVVDRGDPRNVGFLTLLLFPWVIGRVGRVGSRRVRASRGRSARGGS